MSVYAHLSLIGCILRNIVTHSVQCPDEEPREMLCDMGKGVESLVVFSKKYNAVLSWKASVENLGYSLF